MNGRLEDAALLAGHGRFIEDERRRGLLHMVLLRSAVAHGRITRLQTDTARAMPGVRAILTQADVAAHGIGPLRCRTAVTDSSGDPMREPPRSILADEKVVHVGEAIAAIIAETEWQALDALESIELHIDELPVVSEAEAAAQCEPIWPGIPENRSFTWEHGNADEATLGFANAAHVVELTVRHPRIVISPIETRGCLAEFDPVNDVSTLIAPSQGVVALRAALSEAMCLKEDGLRVVTHDVGGSFAVKIWPYPEHVLALLAARLTGAPVKWTGTRSEAFGADAMGRARVDHARLALDRDGRFLAFDIESIADMGAFLNTAAPSIVTEGSVRTLGHVYRIPGLRYRVQAMLTNKVPVDAYRGAGKPETVCTLERLIDVAASELGFDRFALREMNLITPDEIPYATPVGVVYDAGDFPAIAKRIRLESDWDGFSQRKAHSESVGLLRGIGLGFYLHITGGSPAERSEVRALPDGTVRVRTGTQDSGQGHRTALAMVVAQALGLPLESVRVEQGDSAWLATGGGTGGSNLMAIAGNNVHRTAHQMLNNARDAAAELLEAAPADLEYATGRFTIAGTDRFMSLAQIAATFEPSASLEVSGTPGSSASAGLGCVAQCDFQGVHATAPNGAYVFEVEVDPQTGGTRIDRITGVNDLGRVINPQTTDGQLHGAIAQAIGEVLMESAQYDEQGQIINGSLMDYALPRAADMPFMHMSLAATGSPNSLLGVKGVGEVASIGAPGALMNAVHDALRDAGVRHVDMPMTAWAVWKSLDVAGRQGRA